MKRPDWNKPFGRKYGGRVEIGKRVDPTAHAPYVRPTDGPSPGGRFVSGGCPKRIETPYTGTLLIGISVRHKSGLEPVFSQEQAVDLAKMRRN